MADSPSTSKWAVLFYEGCFMAAEFVRRPGDETLDTDTTLYGMMRIPGRHCCFGSVTIDSDLSDDLRTIEIRCLRKNFKLTEDTYRREHAALIAEAERLGVPLAPD